MFIQAFRHAQNQQISLTGGAAARFPLGVLRGALLTNHETVAGHTVFFETGDENVVATIPAFDNAQGEGGRPILANSAQFRTFPSNHTHISVVAAGSYKLTIELGHGGA